MTLKITIGARQIGSALKQPRRMKQIARSDVPVGDRQITDRGMREATVTHSGCVRGGAFASRYSPRPTRDALHTCTMETKDLDVPPISMPSCWLSDFPDQANHARAMSIT
jgi:hypothetical protein